MPGGFEEIEIEESEKDYKTRYGSLDNDALNDEYDTLEDRLLKDPLNDRAQEEMKYIGTLWGKADSQGVVRRRRVSGMNTTSFGGESITNVAKTNSNVDIRKDARIQFDELIRQAYPGRRLNPLAVGTLTLRNRFVEVSRGGIRYRRGIEN